MPDNTPLCQSPTSRRYFRLSPAPLALLIMALGANANEPPSTSEQDTPRHPLDWVPESELTESQRDLMRRACCGAYISPERTDEDAQRRPEESSIRVSADNSNIIQDTFVDLSGDVQLFQGYRSLTADRVEFNQQTREADITGGIEIREPGLLLRGDNAHMQMNTGDAQMDNARFVIQETHIRGDARRLERIGDQIIRMEDSQITSCPPGNNTWTLGGARVSVYPEEQYGTAVHARLNIKGVPVFYAPYLRFPVGDERQSGILPPSAGHSRRNGTEISLPIYWNIHPQYDLTVTPNYMSKRGVLWDAEARHLATHFETTLSGAFIEDDRGGYNRRLNNEIADGLITEEEAYPYRGSDRWIYNVEQSGGGGDQRWTTQIDYAEMSDPDYLRDLDSGSLDVNREAQLRKMASAGYRSENWTYGIRGEELRALSSTQQPYRELPRIHADADYRFGNWQFDLLNEYTRFDINHYYDAPIDNVVVGERFRTDYRLTWDNEWMWGFFKPGVGVKTLQYELDEEALIEEANTSPSLAVPQGSLDMGLFFERDDNLFGYGFTQTLEPRLFYFYSDYEDHSELLGVTANNRNVDFDTTEMTFSYNQLFRTTRFAGGDRIDDANQLSVGITSRFIESSTGVERLSVSLGQIFHFADRRVTRSGVPEEDDTSGLAGQLQAQVTEHLNIRTDLVYDAGDKQIESGNLRLHYMDDQYRIFNLGYRYTRNPPSRDRFNPDLYIDRSLEQVDATVHWPIYGQWSFIARYNHDFTYDRELYTFAGLEYDDCCYRIRLLARRWLDFDYTPNFLEQVTRDDYDQGIVFDIQFKGLGSINDKISGLLNRAIIGYGAREDALH